MSEWLGTNNHPPINQPVYSYLLDQTRLQNAKEGRDKNDISFGRKLAMGCCSGGIGSFIGNPSELALVRLSNDAKLPPEQRRNYSNVVDCLVRIAKEEGVANLWRGATPTVIRATLLSATSLAMTSEIKLRLARSGYFGENGEMFYGLPMMFCSTLCSSFAANIVSNPFDVVKSRIQNMPVSPGVKPMYTGMVDCLRKSVKSDGLLVLWRGFTPAFVKLAPYTVISLTLADKLTKAVTGKSAL